MKEINTMLKPEKIIDMAIQAKDKSSSREEAQIIFCEEFINLLQKIGAKEIAPCLNAEIKTKSRKVVVTLTF